MAEVKVLMSEWKLMEEKGVLLEEAINLLKAFWIYDGSGNKT